MNGGRGVSDLDVMSRPGVYKHLKFQQQKRGHTLTLALRQGSSESSLSLGQVII